MQEIDLIRNTYIRMYEGMINKDETLLDEVLDDSFVLVHMTGMKQDKKAFIRSVLNGTLNYYSARHDDMSVSIDGDEAKLIGKTYVLAAVFGGGKNYWNLQQTCTLKKKDSTWKIVLSEASTY